MSKRGGRKPGPDGRNRGAEAEQSVPARDDELFGSVSGSPAGMKGASLDELRSHIHDAMSQVLGGEAEPAVGTPERAGAAAVQGGAHSAGFGDQRPSAGVSPVPRGAGPASPTAWWLDQHGAEVPLSPGARQQLEVRGRVDAWAASVKRYEQAASPRSAASPETTRTSPRRRMMSHDGLGSRPLSRSFNTPSSASPFPQEAYTATLEQPAVAPSQQGGHMDRHHLEEGTTLDVAMSCWRRGEVGAKPSPIRSASPGAQVASTAGSEASWSVGVADVPLPEPDDCFDAESPHHPGAVLLSFC